MDLKNARQKIFISLGFAVIVMLALSIWADFPKLVNAFSSFRWEFLPLALGLTIWNYLLRFAKWQYYLGLIKANDIKWRDSLLIFLSGFSMTLTPAKIGEWLKSFLLKETNGAPISASAPIIVAERLSDAFALLFLAAFAMFGLLLTPAGANLPPYTQEALIAVFLVIIVVLVVVQWRSLALRILKIGERLPLVSRRFDALERFYESSYVLLRGRSFPIAVGLGIVSWVGECFAFFFVLLGFGVEPSMALIAQATFILAATTVIASVTGLPGGLGVAEVGIVAMLSLLGVTGDQTVATGAMLLIRACTLWFGVIIGAIALFAFTRQMRTLSLPQDETQLPSL